MITIYILQKLLSILILFKLKFFYGFISLFLFFIIFFFKEDSHDILNYVKEVGNTDTYELFFHNIIKIINLATDDKALVITIYQLLLLIFASCISFFFKENKILILSIILSSIAIMLGVHNNLRQGTSSIFILLGIISYIHGNKKIGITLILSSVGFHHSSIFFISLIAVLGMIFNIVVTRNYFKKYPHIVNISFITFVGALFAVIVINYLIYFISFQSYLGRDIASHSQTRLPHELKVLILFLFWLSTEIFIKFRTIDIQIDFFRYLRQFLIFFIVILAFFDLFNEISNRIIYFYYIIEMALLCFYVDRKMYNITVYMLIIYGFALNVWSIVA